MRKQIPVVQILAVFFLLISPCSATDRLVPSQYSTIQAAIDAAAGGDTVIISPGTYTGTGNRDIDFAGKVITVQSTDPEDPCVVAATIIDCENSGRGFYFHSGENLNSVLSGLTIKRGTDVNVPPCGGGIFCSGASPTIKNCVITNNTACRTNEVIYLSGPSAFGGGIFCNGASPVIENCIIANNTAEGFGGFYVGGGGGRAYGGGIYCQTGSHLNIINCTISNNYARGGDGSDGYESPWTHIPPGNGGDGCGGGIYGSADSILTIVSCTISGNQAPRQWWYKIP